MRLDGRSLFRVGAAGDIEPAARARQIERRLQTLLQNPQAVVPARVASSDTDPAARVITVAGVPVVTVSTLDAQDNLTTPEALAAQWAQVIDESLPRSAGRRVSAGILILALRPFELGDQIVVGETEGGVERIELRATQIRTYDGRVVLVPNADVFTSRIINNMAQPIRRGAVELHLGYDQDLRRAVTVTHEAAQAAEGVLPEPPASARVRELGQDDITVEARFWTDSRRSDFLATTSNVREMVFNALKEAGVGLPNPDVRLLVPRRAEKWREALGIETGMTSEGADDPGGSDDGGVPRGKG